MTSISCIAYSVAGHTTSTNASVSHSSRLLEAVPLLLATAYYLSEPFFTSLAAKGLIEYLDKGNREWQGSLDELPPHLSPKAIAANVDWIIDAPQLVPTLLLPLTAVVLAFTDNDVPTVILAFSSIVIPIAALWIYNISPLKYRSYKIVKNKYTVVAATGVLLNGVAAGFVLAR